MSKKQDADVRLLIDENVPRLIWEVFEERGHEVLHVRDRLGSGTADLEIADHAFANGAVVVTWNHSHFRRLSNRLTGQAGLITLKCSEPNGRIRLEKFVEEIEWYHERFFSGQITHLFLEIGETYFKDHR